MRNTRIGVLIVYIYTIVAWIVNLIKFIGCDFAEPYKSEIFHGVGIFVPPVSWVTCWL